MFLFTLYHQLAKQKTSVSKSFSDPETWPDSWKTTYIKLYERFPLMCLPEVTKEMHKDVQSSLVHVLTTRKTKRNFDNPITSQVISDLLYYSIGIRRDLLDTKKEHRMYPSGGSRYPLEFYLIFFKPIGEISEGVYHYDLEAHGLRKLRNTKIDSKSLSEEIGYLFLEHATCAIIFTASFSRVSEKYKEGAYKLILLEAGGAMQNFSLMSSLLDVDSVSVGALAEYIIEPLLDIDGTEESVVHMMFFG